MKMTVSLRYFYSLKILVIKIILLNQISKNTIDFDPNAALRGILIPPPPSQTGKQSLTSTNLTSEANQGSSKLPGKSPSLGVTSKDPKGSCLNHFQLTFPKRRSA